MLTLLSQPISHKHSHPQHPTRYHQRQASRPLALGSDVITIAAVIVMTTSSAAMALVLAGSEVLGVSVAAVAVLQHGVALCVCS